jgi:hypothetical protein
MRILGNLAYLQGFAVDMAYVQLPDRGETARTLRKRLYATLLTIATARTSERTMRIEHLYSDLRWTIGEGCTRL